MYSRRPPVLHIAASLGFGISTRSLAQLLDYFQAQQEKSGLPDPIPQNLEGFCYVCQSRQKFSILQQGSEVNWRETLRCPGCDLINRWRSSVHVFEALCTPDKDCQLYITETVTPLFNQFKRRYEHTVGSEYAADKQSGEWLEVRGEQVMVQDVTCLSFESRSFNAVLSFDVLEHVPDYLSALSEFFRVLEPKGWLILSAPFSFDEQTEVRASIGPDGKIEHHLPPDYHGDPVSGEGVLCFQSFGMDLLTRLECVGFGRAMVFGFTDRNLGYLGKNVVFLAQKPGYLALLLQSIMRWLGFRPRYSGAGNT